MNEASVVCRTDASNCDDLDIQQSKSWLRIAIAAVFAGQGMVLSLALNMTPPTYGSTAYWALHGGLIFLTSLVILFLGGPLFVSTLGMFRTLKLSIEGLFTLSLSGAFAGSIYGSVTGEGNVYYEIVAIVIAIYTFGRMLSTRSQEKVLLEADKLRSELNVALKLQDDGSLDEVDVASLRQGDRIRVEPGEAFVVDGVIVSGNGAINELALTGEPNPVVKASGDSVRAATHSVDGSFTVEVENTLGAREIDRILATVEDPAGNPSEFQEQANRLTQFFLPVVAAVSLLTAVCWWIFGDWHSAFLNSMTVLLIACPCALGLATPVAIWHGLYRLSRIGLVSRDGSLIDGLAKTKRVFFDKTGTLSETSMRVVECRVAKDFIDHEIELLSVAVGIEAHIQHPIADGITNYCLARGADSTTVSKRIFHPGRGVEAEAPLNGNLTRCHLGHFEFDSASRCTVEDLLVGINGKRVALFCDEKLAAVFILREQVRESAAIVLTELKKMGIECEILTGDPAPDLQMVFPKDVAMTTGMSAEAKLDRLRQAVDAKEFPCFVGDGVNDSAAMSAASASIVMEHGSKLTQSTASAQLLSNRLEIVPEAIRTCSGIRRKLRGNLYYAATYNVFGMGFAALGLMHPVLAALIMLLSSFFVTARVLKF